MSCSHSTTDVQQCLGVKTSCLCDWMSGYWSDWSAAAVWSGTYSCAEEFILLCLVVHVGLVGIFYRAVVG